MMKSVIWSQEQRDTAKQMASEGYTASQIAAEIKKTRNSVIGFLHRSKIQLGITNKFHRPKGVKPPPRPRPLKIKAVVEEKVKDYKDIQFLYSGNFQCKYITQESKNPLQVMCCGRPTVYKSWCDTHFKLCFKPKETR